MKHWTLHLVVLACVLLDPTLSHAEDPEWPITFETAKGRLVLYQPQPETFKGDRITARAAVSATPTGKIEPVFGAVWLDARVQTDRENRTVTIVDITVPHVRFPEIPPEKQKALAEFLETEIPKLEISFSLDRLLTSLESAEKQVAADNALKNDPPAILFRSAPTLLVLIDGEPELRTVDDSSIMRVINTPYVLLLYPATKRYYLTDGQLWFSAGAVAGPWSVDANTPQEVRAIAPPDSSEGALRSLSDLPPGVVVATVPTELVLTDGEASYTPVSGTDLLAVTNTESDLFMDVTSQKYFLLLSGRWYASSSLRGSWSFIPSDALPADFAKIPEESEYAAVLPFVAGTDQAKDAVLDASIPQTSAISRDDSSLVVSYDGEPKFVSIEGTQLQYAANTDFSVLQVGGRFYCCHEAVWYEAPSPRGPWTVAVTIPPEIYEQPPSSPTYNTKYVYVYDSTPSVVYVGYLPGYTGCYVYGPTIVYGTGYYYPPYIGPVYYYPRPVTYGFHVRYNPYTGWGFGVTYSTGFVSFGMSWHSRYYPRPPYGGAYYRPPYHRYWGPGGYRPAYPQHRTTSTGRATPGISDRTNIYNRSGNATRNVETSRTPRIQQPSSNRGGNNNVMTDRSGNVYRQNQNGSWQQRESSGWSKPTPTPSTRPEQRPQTSPSRPQQKPQTSQSRPDQLSRDRSAQQRGAQRSQDYNRQRQSSPSRSSAPRQATPRRR